MPREAKTRHATARASSRRPVVDINLHIPTKVAILANRLSRSASSFYRKEYGIGIVEWRLMMCIGRATETRANRICTETDLDKGAVSRSLAVLQRMGIVRIREDGADSRRHKVALTAKGRALHDRLVPIALQRNQELVAGLTEAEVAAFIGMIDHLQAKIADGAPRPVGFRRAQPRRMREGGNRGATALPTGPASARERQ